MRSCRVQAFARLAVGLHTLRLGSQDGRLHLHSDEAQLGLARQVADRFHLIGCHMQTEHVVTHSYRPGDQAAGEAAAGPTVVEPPLTWSSDTDPKDFFLGIHNPERKVPPVGTDAKLWM